MSPTCLENLIEISGFCSSTCSKSSKVKEQITTSSESTLANSDSISFVLGMSPKHACRPFASSSDAIAIGRRDAQQQARRGVGKNLADVDELALATTRRNGFKAEARVACQGLHHKAACPQSIGRTPGLSLLSTSLWLVLLSRTSWSK